MPGLPTPNPGRLTAIAVDLAIVAAFGLALLTLAGWQLGWSALQGAINRSPAMNPMTAVAFLLASVSLWILRTERPSATGRRLAQALAIVVVMIGSVRLLSIVTALPLDVDQLLFRSQLSLASYPNRMAPNTALGFVFLGFALATLDWKTRGFRPATPTLLAVLAISLMTVMGYAYGAPPMYRVGAYIAMAMNTASAFLLLSVGALLSRPDRDPSRLLFGTTSGSLMARRLLPPALLVPLILGWLRLEAQRRGFLVLEVATAVLMLAIIAIQIALIALVARRLDASDVKRRSAEDALQRSLARQKRLVDANLIGVVTATTNGEITEANAEFLRIIGYRREDLPLHTDRITPPEWRERNAVAIAELAEGGVASPWEKEYVRKDGTRVRVLVGAAALPDSNGECVAFALDLTDRVRAEAETRRVQAFLDSVVEHLPSMIFVKEAGELRFVRLNRAAENLIGLPREKLLGKCDFDFFPRDQAEFFVAKDREVLKEGKLVDIPEEPLSTPEGETRLLHTRKVPLFDESGEPAYLLGISEDITERRAFEKQVESLHRTVRRHAEGLEAANRELEAFSYSVSHDLRAPLRHMAGFADLLLRHNSGQLDETGRRRLETIAQAAGRMGELIDDLLAFSRMGRVDLRRARVDLNELVRNVRREQEAETRGRRIRWDIRPLPEVDADPAMLRLAIANLLSNAVKYTRPREEAVIEVGGSEDPVEGAVVYVRDNGVGFDMEYVGKLFGVFQRLHRAEEFEGTGIGLANVQRIIHRHGGRTWAEGALDRGATFYFSLPAPQKEEAWTP